MATAKTSIWFIFSSKVGVRVKQITAYSVWLNIEYNAAFEAQNFR